MAKGPAKLNKYLRFSTVGLEMGLSVIIGLFVGQWLDRQFDTSPWLLLVFLMFGMVAGFRSVFRLMRDVNRQSESNATSDDESP